MQKKFIIIGDKSFLLGKSLSSSATIDFYTEKVHRQWRQIISAKKKSIANGDKPFPCNKIDKSLLKFNNLQGQSLYNE
ncbi:MAG: hypothetical protein ACK5LR_05045 [Mangrovibacterium sp.]